MRQLPALAAAAVLVAVGCSSSYHETTPVATPPTAALVPWNAFPADQVPRPVVFSGNVGPASEFASLEMKLPALCRKFQSGTTLSTKVPTRAQVTWTVGTTATYPAISAAAAFAAMKQPSADTPDPNCATAQTLVINGAYLSAFDFATDRGNARISAWMFTVSGAMGAVAYPALATSAFWNGGSLNGYSNGGSTLNADGRTLTFTFWGEPSASGPCGADYTGLMAESGSAVAVAVQAHSHASPGALVACPAVAEERSVTVTLASPLGGRVLVDSSGAAVSVCPVALTKSC